MRLIILITLVVFAAGCVGSDSSGEVTTTKQISGEGRQSAEATTTAALPVSPPAISKFTAQMETFISPALNANFVQWSPDGKKLAYHTDNITLWDISTNKTFNIVGDIASWSPDGKKIVTTYFYLRDIKSVSTQFMGIKIWDVGNAAELKDMSMSDYKNGIYDISWSPDGKKIAISFRYFNSTIIIDSSTGSLMRKLNRENKFEKFEHISWSPDGTKIATSSYGEPIIIWDSESGAEVKRIDISDNKNNLVSWSPDGKRIAGGYGGSQRSDYTDGVLAVWKIV